jgi:hypothetical protein
VVLHALRLAKRCLVASEFPWELSGEVKAEVVEVLGALAAGKEVKLGLRDMAREGLVETSSKEASGSPFGLLLKHIAWIMRN